MSEALLQLISKKLGAIKGNLHQKLHKSKIVYKKIPKANEKRKKGRLRGCLLIPKTNHQKFKPIINKKLIPKKWSLLNLVKSRNHLKNLLKFKWCDQYLNLYHNLWMNDLYSLIMALGTEIYYNLRWHLGERAWSSCLGSILDEYYAHRCWYSN